MKRLLMALSFAAVMMVNRAGGGLAWPVSDRDRDDWNSWNREDWNNWDRGGWWTGWNGFDDRRAFVDRDHDFDRDRHEEHFRIDRDERHNDADDGHSWEGHGEGRHG